MVEYVEYVEYRWFTLHCTPGHMAALLSIDKGGPFFAFFPLFSVSQTRTVSPFSGSRLVMWKPFRGSSHLLP